MERDAAHFPLAAIVPNRNDIVAVEAFGIGAQLHALALPGEPHPLNDRAHRDPALAVLFERREAGTVEVEAVKVGYGAG